MINTFIQQYAPQIDTLRWLLLLVNALIHLLFAGAIARDAGKLYQLGQKPALVSASTWAFAALLGGVMTAAIYWFIHHSTLTRPPAREVHYER
ncbi:hypothetical protein ACFORL_04910 [Legionella dresdenensis]|uniref:Uncharacterized protein n=1 Tax=Legionella dresdenensis TaxID=450200 RepID=A0ABV8CDV0_9GAMM